MIYIRLLILLLIGEKSTNELSKLFVTTLGAAEVAWEVAAAKEATKEKADAMQLLEHQACTPAATFCVSFPLEKLANAVELVWDVVKEEVLVASSDWLVH